MSRNDYIAYCPRHDILLVWFQEYARADCGGGHRIRRDCCSKLRRGSGLVGLRHLLLVHATILGVIADRAAPRVLSLPSMYGRRSDAAAMAARLIQDYLGQRDPQHTGYYTGAAGRRFEGLWAPVNKRVVQAEPRTRCAASRQTSFYATAVARPPSRPPRSLAHRALHPPLRTPFRRTVATSALAGHDPSGIVKCSARENWRAFQLIPHVAVLQS
jgi:hypothetical protein